ncbi:MAG TPA: 50S ribosomal protein L25 [Candidatus Atribacteria bacterium]|nr:50S ribosomal protein L25 [Candidatus Atribacteria bacterium]
MVEKGNVTINLERREEKGKGKSRKLRREGWIPAVLYSRESKDGKAELVKVREKDLKRVLQMPGITHHMLDLSLEGETRKGIIRDLQKNPIKEEIWHVDFYEVQTGQRITLSLPVRIKGEAKGVETGGTLQLVTQELEVECPSGAIPEGIEVDVSELEIGDTVRVGDLKVPQDVTVLEDPDEVIVVIIPPRVEVIEEEIEEELEEEVEEPQVIGRGKAEEEEAEEEEKEE